ncbi:MAG: M13 family metallopeptidase [Altererythrobacter sp.]|nr:M13 family metallopeptidase [Altererythrobacter sp.]
MIKSLWFALGTAAVAATQVTTAFGSWGFDLAGVDRTVRPGDDFYAYANGSWARRTSIPDGQVSAGSYDELRLLSERRMRELISGLRHQGTGSLDLDQARLVAFYEAYMDRAAIEARGLQPVEAGLARIAQAATPEDIAALMGDPALDLPGPFAVQIQVDDRNSRAYVATISQGGLALAREAYLEDGATPVALRAAYLDWLMEMLAAAGAPGAPKRAGAVLALETRMAEAGWSAAERRDVGKTYNPTTVAGLAPSAPGFPFMAWLSARGLVGGDGTATRRIVVREQSALPKLAAIFAATPVSVWRDYLTVHYLRSLASVLPAAVDEPTFAFFGTKLSGQVRRTPAEVRALRLMAMKLSDPFSKAYTARYFPASDKAKAEALVANIKRAFAAQIAGSRELSEPTRHAALRKLAAMRVHVGYPGRWRDYSGLAIDRKDPVGNLARSNLFEWRYRLARLNGLVDRDEWMLPAMIADANNSEALNAIFFPAAILQPPMFDAKADDAVNYGAIGATIGHEIGHGFDDRGARFDAAGDLKNWWTADDEANFSRRRDALAAQFDSYEALPGVRVNGRLTMGENLADLSGLASAYRAYRLSLAGRAAPVRDGYSGDQRFFLAYAQMWRFQYREAALRNMVAADPHSPAQFRVNGVVRNFDVWYKAFGIAKSELLYLEPAARVRPW